MAHPDGFLRDESAIAATIATIAERFGDRLQTGGAIRAQHGHTTTWIANQPPDAVVFPGSTADVAQIVGICARFGAPVIPFGAGTSLEGHVNAPKGGICVDLSRMDRILAVNTADHDCIVEPGVTRSRLNTHLRDQGLFFPIDPGADATLGGMASTRASGTNAVRYGTMRDNVLALEAVMPDGSVITTGGRARKSAAGYDLARLLIGAEGTLGIITALTLRLRGIPEAISSATCSFPTVRAACDAVIATIQMGIPVARIELLDALQVRASNAYSKLGLPEAPLLLLEFHGSAAAVAEQAADFGAIAGSEGGSGFAWTATAEARNALWQARHDAYWAALALRPGARGISTDVCVPISRLADCIDAAQARIRALGLVAPIVGHVGDGNFHTLLLIDMNDPAEIARAEAFTGWLSDCAIAMNGTCTGEHGIGQGKRPYLARELGPAVGVMASIKRALDPRGIMNPGKILPP
jgi:D-lactate dehydrogenase (cytochrome)